MKKQPLYSLRSVSKAYAHAGETVQIFNNMDLQIEQGDFIAVTGPSGSGKTTLLNLLGGLDAPEQGEIFHEGQRIDNLSQNQICDWRAKHVAFIFQSYNLIPTLSVSRNVELPLMLRSARSHDRRTRVSMALELVGLTGLSHRLPNQLSGGQQQRVAIARALVSNSNVLLCDEPTGNLDRHSSTEIMDSLALLNSEYSKTIILVTHDHEAACYAQRTYMLDKGQFLSDSVQTTP